MFMIYDNISIIFYSDSTSNCNKIYTIIIITILVDMFRYVDTLLLNGCCVSKRYKRSTGKVTRVSYELPGIPRF